MGTATIIEWNLTPGNSGPVNDDDAVSLTVDFDPADLELSYTTTGPDTALDATKATSKNKTPAQITGQNSTLSMTLVFDTSTENGVSVQTKTDPLVLLTGARGANHDQPRVIRFQWGTFFYYGTVASLSQKIDFFSDQGVPLRSTVQLTIKQIGLPSPATGSGAGISVGVAFGAGVGIGASVNAAAAIGTAPLTLSQDGDTVQAIAARAGGATSWKAVAAANDIDNPRLLPPGTVLSTSVTANAQFGASAG